MANTPNDGLDRLEDRSGLPATTMQDALILDERKSKYALPVYVALCYFAKSAGKCFPAIRRIGRVTGLGETTVKAAIKELTELGYVTKESRTRGDGGKTSNLYTIARRYRFSEERPPSDASQGEGRAATMGESRAEEQGHVARTLEGFRGEPGDFAAQTCRHVRDDRGEGRPATMGEGRSTTGGMVAGRIGAGSRGDHELRKELVVEQKEREETGSRSHANSKPAHGLSLVFIQNARKRCEEHGLPAALISPAWLKAVADLLGPFVTEDDLLGGLAACLNVAPEKLTFFAQDYAQWSRRAAQLAKEEVQSRRRAQAEKAEREARARERQELESIRKNPESRSALERGFRDLRRTIGLAGESDARHGDEAGEREGRCQ